MYCTIDDPSNDHIPLKLGETCVVYLGRSVSMEHLALLLCPCAVLDLSYCSKTLFSWLLALGADVYLVGKSEPKEMYAFFSLTENVTQDR